MLDILNPVATDIFMRCNGKDTIGDIVDHMMEEYAGVERKTLVEDVKNFIEHMVKEKVFFVVE